MRNQSKRKKTVKPTSSRARQSRVAVRDPLTMERVVAAAIELMDRQGVAALSMRKLGSHLSVQAMSLYGYFKNKEDLLLAVRSALFEKIRDADAANPNALERLRGVMTSTYRLVEQHPCFVDIVIGVPLAPTQIRRAESDLAALRSLGFSAEEAAFALQTLASFVIGYLHQRQLISAERRDAAFEFGLSTILNGLRDDGLGRRKVALEFT